MIKFKSLFFSVCLLTCFHNMALSQESGVELNQKINAEFAETAIVNRWRRSRDLITPTLMLKGASMALSGKSRDEIIRELSTERQRWESDQSTGLRANWEVNEDYKIMIQHGGALAGQALGARVGVNLSRLTQAMVDLSIMTFEDFARDGHVQDSSRQLGLLYKSISASEQAIASYISKIYSENELFREVYNEQFALQIGFSPSDSPETIMNRYPEFASQENIQAIVRILTNNGDGSAFVRLTDDERASLESFIESSLNELREDNGARLEGLSGQVSSVGTGVNQLLNNEERRRQLELERRRNEVRYEGIRSTAYLASTLIGLLDEESAVQMNAVMDVAFEINRSVEAFQAASKLGDVSSFASITLTGNIVGVVSELVGVFSNSGPTPEEMILREIAKLRQELSNLRVEMHKRFDIVDKRLNIIFERLDTGLMDLNNELQFTTNRALNAIQAQIRNVNLQQLTATSLIMNSTEQILAQIGDDNLAPCLDNKEGANLDLTHGAFVDCALILARRVQQSSLIRFQENFNGDDLVSITNFLRNYPNLVSNYSYSNFALNQSVQTIVGPENWIYAVNSYLGFISDWPQYRQYINPVDSVVLRTEGEKLLRAIRRIQRGLINFSNGDSSPSLDFIVQGFENSKIQLNNLISHYEHEFYRESLRRPPLNLLNENQGMDVRNLDIQRSQSVSCHSNIGHQINADNYELPLGISELLPDTIKQAIDLGIGQLRYCIFEGYDQPGEIRRDTGAMVPVWVPNGPGPYYSRVQIDFAWSEIDEEIKKAQRPFRQARVDYFVGLWGPYGEGLVELEEQMVTTQSHLNWVTVFDVQVNDQSRVEPPRNPFFDFVDGSIWANHWRDRYFDAVVEGGSHVIINDWWKAAGKIIEEPIKDAINQELDSFKAQLANYLDEQLNLNALGSESGGVMLSTDQSLLSIYEIDQNILLTSAQLSHWFWMGYSDKLQRNDLLAALVSGGIRPLTISESLHQVRLNRLAPWKVSDVYASQLDEFLSILKSEIMKSSLEDTGDSFGIDAMLHRIPDEW